MPRTMLPIALPLLLAACQTDGEPDPVGPGPADASTTLPGASPQSGLWRYQEYQESTNTCGSRVTVGQGSGDFALDNGGAGTFVITPGDGTAPFQCTLSGGTFNCPDRASSMSYSSSAMLTAHVSFSGSFADAQRGSGSQNGRVDCAGSDCAVAQVALGVTFPCSFSVNATIRWLRAN